MFDLIPTVSQPHVWGVVLAGGQGSRLSPLTQLICGDDRPKQFCPLFRGQTLLEQTRARLECQISPDRTLIVLNQEHEPFYRTSLNGLGLFRRVEQPANIGTAPAIVYSLLRIFNRDSKAVVVFSPADHHYTFDQPYLDAIRSGLDIARDRANSIVLLGAEAEFPNTEYGWIEPSTANITGHKGCYEVQRFWEKPRLTLAQELHRKGCLWNTFVLVGRAVAFLRAVRSAVPKLLEMFEKAMVPNNPRAEAENMRNLYGTTAVSDFSKDVLSRVARNLLVLQLDNSGWSDLGTPERVLQRMSQMGLSTNGWEPQAPLAKAVESALAAAAQ
jgi:mannose-1-phosphate guanylyltransferase